MYICYYGDVFVDFGVVIVWFLVGRYFVVDKVYFLCQVWMCVGGIELDFVVYCFI